MARGEVSTTKQGGDEIERETPELLSTVAGRLRDLEKAASGAAEELRRQAVIAGPDAPGGRANAVAGAVLHELILTLSERANGLEHEAELIAGILERAREAIVSPAAPRRPHPRSLPGRARLTGSGGPRRARTSDGGNSLPAQPSNGEPPREDPGRDAGKPSAGVKLLAAQMALEGASSDAIQGRLRSEFGVDDPASAVKEVLGGGTRS